MPPYKLRYRRGGVTFTGLAATSRIFKFPRAFSHRHQALWQSRFSWPLPPVLDKGQSFRWAHSYQCRGSLPRQRTKLHSESCARYHDAEDGGLICGISLFAVLTLA